MYNNNCFTLLPQDRPGTVTTFYAYEGGAARNALLVTMAQQLADDPAHEPVLMIDWDLESPALHACAGCPDIAPAGEPSGLLELFSALGEAVRRRPDRRDHDADALADALLNTVDWRNYVERADGRRPLYLMRAGRFDDSFAGRAGRLDWHALFAACPALFRRFAARLARHFRHVLVACRAGRSPGVSICTALVPDRIVGLFTPAPASLAGLEGVIERAIDYRCSHEDEQRPLLVFPVACAADGARSDPGQRWRRGDAAQELAGYQPRVEAMLRGAYGMSRLHLESWFDELQLPLCEAAAIAAPGVGRRALSGPADCLLSWFRHGYFPWQSLAEVRLRAAIVRARADPDAVAPLAASLEQLGVLCQKEGRGAEAGELLRESLELRRTTLGRDHADARAALRALAALQLDSGNLPEARRDYAQLAEACACSAGAEHPDTLAARSQLAGVLGLMGESERALALHEQVVATCERLWGDEHCATLYSLEDLALTLGRQREFDRARILYERVLDARRRLQGGEHEDTLRCGQRLAQVLGETDDLGNARRLLEAVLRARVRQDGAESLPTLKAREALADILDAQGDLAAVRHLQERIARTRERQLGAGAAHAPGGGLRDACTGGAPSGALQRQLAQLQKLVDSSSAQEARALADSLRPTVLRPGVALPLRQRGRELIEQAYLQDGDLGAALAFNKDLVSSLEGALLQAAREHPVALR